ncbi:hypothetical protein GCM10010896_21060 [Mammaliicoccus stepanovicii]|uniref:N-acetyltransferase domain-containing protein n=1 Tax=Mammaliicoccus stepanovicii TaxID=643214 RepID=A0A239XY15_9STAP|nr:N-acetyltransferase [Mammaliicoccus stepanovicii]GGI42967.1 hypothetical protein GCM10010896_21060 [Mammaliicoccus stepanovicii]SNV51685.1 Uncharacterised protein [Mammaliicoccus stepanovicii]
MTNACLEYAFDILGLEQIYTYMTIDNLSSQKVTTKIGLKKYKEFNKNSVLHIIQISFKGKGTN